MRYECPSPACDYESNVLFDITQHIQEHTFPIPVIEEEP